MPYSLAARNSLLTQRQLSSESSFDAPVVAHANDTYNLSLSKSIEALKPKQSLEKPRVD